MKDKDKIKVKQVIIVEGKYDKIKLDSIFDAFVVTTEGFRIYKDKKKMKMIKTLAERYGAIILTDSDVAGFKIRNFISGFLPKSKITHVYVPQIIGKEKRKVVASKENLLGVEGIEKSKILQNFKLAGVFLCDEEQNKFKDKKIITEQDFYEDGLIGKIGSGEKRQIIKQKFDLPNYLSTKKLIDILNKMLTYDEYKKIISVCFEIN